MGIHIGGIRLKIISMIVIIILSTVAILNTVILTITQDALQKKAFEVSHTFLSTVSNFSSTALYKRSLATKVILDELLKKIKDSQVQGLLDISIFYAKKDQGILSYYYYSGFGSYTLDAPLSKEKTQQIQDMAQKKQRHITTRYGSKNTHAYQFVEHVTMNLNSQPLELGLIILSYDTDATNSVITKVLHLSYIATAIILAISIFFANYIGVLLSRPIISISKAAKKVSSGDLNINLEINTNDEIGLLASEFNSMVQDLKERSKMKKFVSSSTMDMIAQKEEENINLGGEYKTQTFLFSDIRAFTQMSENCTPREVVSILNFYLNLQSKIVLKNGGDIDKYVGDEIMATFNGINATKNALNAAIEIQENIAKENIQRIKNNLTPCEVGIGINEGEVIVGNIGSIVQMDFTSIGSSVNLAARLCSCAKANEVLISQESCSFDTQDYKLKDAPAVRLKGFSEPVKVYSILVDKLS